MNIVFQEVYKFSVLRMGEGEMFIETLPIDWVMPTPRAWDTNKYWVLLYHCNPEL